MKMMICKYDFHEDLWSLYSVDRLIMSIDGVDVREFQRLLDSNISERDSFRMMCANEIFKALEQKESFAVCALIRNILLQ